MSITQSKSSAFGPKQVKKRSRATSHEGESAMAGWHHGKHTSRVWPLWMWCLAGSAGEEGMWVYNIDIMYYYGQELTFARGCNATIFGMWQMYCKYRYFSGLTGIYMYRSSGRPVFWDFWDRFVCFTIQNCRRKSQDLVFSWWFGANPV